MKLPLVLVAVAAAFLPAAGVAADDRDWAGVQLAWRGDPRATADAPFEPEVPQGRRPSRRAQRRAAARRRMPLDGLPVDVGPDAANAANAAKQPTVAGPFQTRLPEQTVFPVPTVPVARSAIPVEATLGSPFAEPSPASGMTAHRDQPVGPSPNGRQRFDLFLPAPCGGGAMPLVVWIHGDSWRDGSKSDCPILWLTEEGYAVASIGYRLTDTATFPAQLDDCRAAVDEIARNAEVWGIDRERIAAIGAGGGGHLAALVGLAPASPNGRPVAAVCAVAAPTHLTTLGPAHDRQSSPASLLVGGPVQEFREAAQQASPLAHVSADDPPCLVIHGRDDGLIPADQAIRLDAALQAAGVDSTLVLLEGIGHAPALDRSSPAGRAIVEFLDRTLGPGITARPAE